VLGASQASALSEVQVDPASEFLLAEDEPLWREQQAPQNSQTLFAVLEEVLEATQAKLEELSGATAILADSDLRKDVQALKEENGRLVAELEQARTRQTELESSNQLAEARIARLMAVDAAVMEAAQVDWELAELRRKNAQLEESLARAHAAREALEAKAAERAKLREEFEAARQELAMATSARRQIEGRASEMEEALVSSSAETARLKTELAETKEQLGQAVGAVIQAEQARLAATAEAESLRAEAE
jgi:chromosome segregation ATPase